MTERAPKLAVLVAGAAVLAFHAWAKPRPSEEEIRAYARNYTDPQAWRERVAPDFELTLLDGSTFRLADRIGKQVVILNFFATWCGPCRAEMPELERYHQAYAEDVLLLGVDAEEKHTVVEAFVAEMKVTFPVAIDGAGDVLKLYGVNSFPTTVVIGADGRVKMYEVGAISNAEVGLGGVVNPAIAALRDGRGVTRDAYLSAAASESPQPAGAAKPLEGRGRRIAEAMPCPCGCSEHVIECRCKTASGIKARLAQGGYDGKTDAEVMEELNREFCMRGS